MCHRGNLGIRMLVVVAILAVAALSLPAIQAQAPDRVVIWSPGDNGSVQDWNTDPILAEVEKATNTEIEMVKIGWDTFNDQVNAAIASGNLPDIIGVIDHNNRTLIDQWVSDGVVAPFEGEVAAAAPNLIAMYDQNPTLAELKIDGKIYGQPIFWGTDNYPNMGLLHIRKDLLDKYGLEAPETLDQYFDYLRACVADGRTGAVFEGSSAVGVNQALNAFAGAQGLPIRGWVKAGDGFGYWAVQPGIKDALLLFRQMVAEGLVDPLSWEGTSDQARAQYITGKACSYIFNGGGHIGRIQNDLTLAAPGAQEWVLPAPMGASGQRGYTTEPQFWGLSFIGNMANNNPVAAARVLNFLASEEGTRLTALGVEDVDYTVDNGEITLTEERRTRGFPTEAGDTGAHPLATTIVSWVPQELQDFGLLYGKDAAFREWYQQMWANQGEYQIGAYGLLSTTPLWTEFASTSTELSARAFVEIVRSGSDADASAQFDQFVSDWNAQGGADATAEMSAMLSTIYQ